MSVVKSGDAFSTPQALCLFPQVEKSDRNEKYSVIVAFKKDSDELKLMKKVYDDLMLEAFGDKKPPMGFKIPFRDGDQKMYQDKETGDQSVRAGFEGKVYITMRTQDKPFVIDQTGKKAAPEGSLVHGRYVIPNTTPFVWRFEDQGMVSNGFSFGLNAVQVTNKIDNLPGGGGSRIDPLDTFGDVSGEEGSAPEDDPVNYQEESLNDMFG